MKDRTDRNESLREALRRGDPAGEEAGLTPEEIQAMRRTVLSAVPPPRERLRLVPAFVTAAAVVLSFVVALTLWRTQEHPPAPKASGEPAVSIAAQPPSAPPLASPETPSRPPVKSAARPHRPARASVLAQHRPATRPRSAPPEEPADTPTRQVQFSTPGGTRVIWMLPQTTR
jgi:hypothetical protein